ncbi:hypothetical protein [Actinoplanes sp. HUAS TT8]|uniref:hypothetical protein n=1 Tax=Actinoplanes sp. HUAS TT8 TaxID=3447453 RepID=UPI003F51F1B2
MSVGTTLLSVGAAASVVAGLVLALPASATPLPVGTSGTVTPVKPAVVIVRGVSGLTGVIARPVASPEAVARLIEAADLGIR